MLSFFPSFLSRLCLSHDSRVRVLPPLDERLYRALQRAAVAVLDPFPVGTHVQIMEAMVDGIPVVSS